MTDRERAQALIVGPVLAFFFFLGIGWSLGYIP